jgi:hypothetical protein
MGAGDSRSTCAEGWVRRNRVTVADAGLVFVKSRQAPAHTKRRPSFTGTTRGAGRSSCTSLRLGRRCGTGSVGRRTPAIAVHGFRCVHELGVLLRKRHHCSRSGSALEAHRRGCSSCTGTHRLRAAGRLQAAACRLLALVTGARCRARRPTRGPRATPLPLVGTPSLLPGGCCALALVTGAHLRGRRPTRGVRLTASLGWRRPFPLTELDHAQTTCA